MSVRGWMRDKEGEEFKTEGAAALCHNNHSDAGHNQPITEKYDILQMFKSFHSNISSWELIIYYNTSKLLQLKLKSFDLLCIWWSDSHLPSAPAGGRRTQAQAGAVKWLYLKMWRQQTFTGRLERTGQTTIWQRAQPVLHEQTNSADDLTWFWICCFFQSHTELVILVTYLIPSQEQV